MEPDYRLSFRLSHLKKFDTSPKKFGMYKQGKKENLRKCGKINVC